MRLSQLIAEVGYEVDRTSIDDRVKYWIQGAVDILYLAIPKRERQRSATLTAVSTQQWLNVPADFGDFDRIYNSDKEELAFIPPGNFFDKGRVAASGTPTAFTFWNNQFLFSPVPDAGVVFTLNYLLEKPNIYVHNLTVEYKASVSTYKQVYIDEDGGSDPGEGKLLFVSPTTTDARILLQSVDEHQHEIIVYHDAAAAANGVAWYFDDDASNAWERNFFISPTKANAVIKTVSYRKHHHYLNFIHNPAPTAYPDANNRTVFLDEDANARDLRIAGVLPSTADASNELVHSKEGELPGFLERYHVVLHELSVARGHRFNHDYDSAKEHSKAASGIMAMITGQPNKLEEPEES